MPVRPVFRVGERSMSNGRALLGECPNCEHSLDRTTMLIRYESNDGWPKTYASCPGCGEVVHPR